MMGTRARGTTWTRLAVTPVLRMSAASWKSTRFFVSSSYGWGVVITKSVSLNEAPPHSRCQQRAEELSRRAHPSGRYKSCATLPKVSTEAFGSLLLTTCETSAMTIARAWRSSGVGAAYLKNATISSCNLLTHVTPCPSNHAQ